MLLSHKIYHVLLSKFIFVIVNFLINLGRVLNNCCDKKLLDEKRGSWWFAERECD